MVGESSGCRHDCQACMVAYTTVILGAFCVFGLCSGGSVILDECFVILWSGNSAWPYLVWLCATAVAARHGHLRVITVFVCYIVERF